MANKNNPKLLLTGSLNVGATIGEINQQLKEISKKINKIKVSIDIDEKMVSKLNAISNGMKNVRTVSQEMNKVLKQEETVIKNLDGSTERLTRSYLKSGEVIEKSRKTIDKNSKAKEKEVEATNQLINAEDKLGRKLKETRKFNAQGQLTNTSSTFGDKYNNTTISTNADNKIQNSKQNINLEAARKDQEKKEKDHNEQLKKIASERAKIREQLNAISSTGKLSDVQKNTINQSLISSKSLDDIKKAKDLVNQTTQSINAQIKQQQEKNKLIAQEYELQKRNSNKESIRVSNLGNKVGSVNTRSFSNNFSSEKANMESYIKSIYGINTSISKLERVTNAAGQQMWQFNAQIKGLKNIETVKGSIDKTTQSIYEQSRALKEQHKDLSIMEAFSTAMVKFPIWLAASTAIFGTARALREMTTVIIEVDTAMTNLKKVMSLDTNFTEVLDSAIAKGQEFGKTITDVLSAYETFARQGYNQRDIGFMSDASLIASNVGEIDAAQAADYLTASIVQFKLETKDAMSVVDAWNNVSNKNATTVEKLAQGHARAAATARSFGLDMHELNGIIGTVTAATKQSGNEVGNFVKNVLPRLLSDDAKGTLDSLGIALTDKSGEMRKATDIYADVAKQFDNMSRSQRNMVAETLAGKYHISRMTALLSNWDMYEKQLTDSIDSKNSAMNENATYMQSMQAKINLLKQGFQQLSLAIGGAVLSDGFIGLISGLTALAKAGTVVTKTIGFLPVVLGTAGLAAMIFSTRLRAATIQTMITTRGLTALATTARATQVALASTGVGLALVGVGILVENLISHYSKLKREQEEAESQSKRYQKASVDALMNNSDQVSSLITKYKQLSDEKNKGALDTKKEEEYAKVTRELADLFPNLIDHIDSKGKAHLIEGEEIDKVVESTKEYIKLKKEEAILKAPEQFDKAKNKSNGIQDEINDLQKKLDSGIKTRFKDNIIRLSDEEENALKQRIVILKNQLSIGNKEINKEAIKLANANIDAGISINSKISDQIDEFVGSLDLSKVNTKQFQNIASEIAKAKKDMTKAFADDDSKALAKSSDELLNSLDKLSNAKGLNGLKTSIIENNTAIASMSIKNKEAKATVEEMVGALDSETGALDENSDSKWENVSATEILYGVTSDQISNMEQAIKIVEMLSGVENQSAQQKELLAQATQYLSDMYPHLNGQISKNIGYIKTQAQAYNIINDASANTATTQMANEYLKTNKVASETQNRINSMIKEIQAIEALSSAYARQSAALKGMAKNAAGVLGDNQIQRMLNQAKTIDVNYGSEIAKLNSLKNQVSRAKGELSKVVNKQTDLGRKINTYTDKKDDKKSGGSKDKKDKGKSGSGSDKSKDIYQTDKYKNALANLDLKIEQSQARAEKLTKSSKAYREELYKQIYLIKQKQKLSGIEVKNLDKEYNALQKTLKATKDKAKRGEIQKKIDDNRDKYRSIKSDLISDGKDITSLRTSYKDSMAEAQTKAIEALIKKVETSIANRVEKLEELSSKLQLNELSTSENKESQSLSIQKEIVKEVKNKQLLYTREVSLLKEAAEKNKNNKTKFAEINALIKEKSKLLTEANIQLAQEEKNLVEIRSSIADQIIETEKKYYEAIKDSKLKAIEDEKEAFDKMYQSKTKAYDDELNNIKKVYDAKIKALQDEKEANDFEKDLKRKQEEQQKIQEKINKLSLNDSLEAKAKRVELEQQLADKQEEIAEYVADHNLNLQLDALDKEQQNRESAIQQQKDQLEQLREMNETHWSERQKAAEDAYNDLMENEIAWAKKHDELMKGTYDGDLKLLNTFIGTLDKNMQGLSDNIQNSLLKTLKDTVDLINQINKSSDKTSTSSSSSKWKTSTSSGKTANKKSTSTSLPTFHEGGVVGSKPLSPIQKFANRLFNVQPGEQIIKAKNGELFIPQENIANGLRNISNNLFSSIKPTSKSSQTAIHNEYKFVIENFTGSKADGDSFIDYVSNALKLKGLR